MSADYYISCADCDETHNGNITYNLTPMLREAGYPPHKAMTGAPLLADPERFKALNPENGWGDYGRSATSRSAGCSAKLFTGPAPGSR